MKCLSVILCLISFAAHAQFSKSLFNQSIGHNIFSAEVRGVGTRYSVNYEHVVANIWNNNILISAGIGYQQKKGDGYKYTTIPYRICLSLGWKGHFAEATYFRLREKENSIGVTGSTLFHKEKYNFYGFGYRFQKNKKGVFLRAYLFPVISSLKNRRYTYFYHLGYDINEISELVKTEGKQTRWWGGIGIGYHFGRW